jgi:8-oxo-dGTP pyrophosphatase MutT (NUDIX family)
MTTIPSNTRAGGALVRRTDGNDEVLLMRVRRQELELPKGGIEPGETPQAAAVREFHEETGIEGPLSAAELLGQIDYFVGEGDARALKRVVYFRLVADGALRFGPRPARTRELRWVTRAALDDTALVNEDLRAILLAALCAT